MQTYIEKSSTFVVDVRCLKNQKDIKKDEFGIWQYSGSHPQCFYVRQKDDGYIDIENVKLGKLTTAMLCICEDYIVPIHLIQISRG